LFDVLDTNRDQRISFRELRLSLARVDLWDEDDDGEVAVEEIPRRLRATVALGAPNLGGPFLVAAAPAGGMAPQSTGQAAPNAPRWFQKMDVNNDGEVSRREFLGTAADFVKLDADKNDAIGVGEAASAKR
jgi:Ca2+-binding EF-hand superfamily protein